MNMKETIAEQEGAIHCKACGEEITKCDKCHKEIEDEDAIYCDFENKEEHYCYGCIEVN